MAGEGFDTERPGDLGAHDPGRAAREAADRIAQQVRDILQTAEQRAADIRSGAERDADAIRKDAAGAAARLLERVDELEEQLDTYLNDFFATIRNEVEALSTREEIEAAAAASRPQAEPEPQAEVQPEPEPEPEPEPQPQEAEQPRRRRGLLWGRRQPTDAEEPAAEANGAEDAHVMALNMALNGTPRDETESYLVQRFGRIEDLDSILDDVYGRVKRR